MWFDAALALFMDRPACQVPTRRYSTPHSAGSNGAVRAQDLDLSSLAHISIGLHVGTLVECVLGTACKVRQLVPCVLRTLPILAILHPHVVTPSLPPLAPVRRVRTLNVSAALPPCQRLRVSACNAACAAVVAVCARQVQAAVNAVGAGPGIHSHPHLHWRCGRWTHALSARP